MKKKEQGILTVEASIVLTLCILFMLFIFSFARVYNAQSVVSHAVLQSSDAVALESYFREETFTGSEADVTELVNRFLGTTSISAESYTSLRSADVSKIAKEKFVYAIGQNESEADEKLKKLGVKNGLEGVDFSGSRMDLGNDDVIVYANYTVEMQFGVFGMDEISVTKAARSKTFGDILFGLDVKPNDPTMGSTSGSGSYKYGTEVQISANPNYGYRFVKWSDGNTSETRTVTVTGSRTYIAYFEAMGFGVTVKSNPEKGGTGTGGGEYNYLSTAKISASPSAGYKFNNWSIYKHKDKTTSKINESNVEIKIDQSYTCTANFSKRSFKVNVEVEGGPSKDYVSFIYNNKTYKSYDIPFESSIKLNATSDVPGYVFLGWKEKGTTNPFTTSNVKTHSVPAKDVTYVAMYQAVGINISGGSVNVNSTQLTAKTVPSNISVKWKSSNSKVSVNGSGLITAKAGSGDAVITATMTYMGKEYSDSVTINLGESQHNVIYCMNMDNSGYRYYTDVHYKLAGTGNSKWGVNFNKSRNHHCFSNNCCGGHANKTVGYSTLYNSKTVNPGDFFRNSIYAGYNKTQKTGYVFNNGSGDAIYFEIKQTTSGPRGFYIKKIYY